MSNFTLGTVFVGNVNGKTMEIVRMGVSHYRVSDSKVVVIKDLETNKLFKYGLAALEHCDVTIVRNKVLSCGPEYYEKLLTDYGHIRL